MWAIGIANRWLMLTGIPLLRRIPFVRDLPFVHGYFWIRDIELPDDDRQRLDRAVNVGTASFIGPNHPEFGTDWLIDKEVSTYCAPRMASWADRGIVSAAPKFFSLNNLIANDGGEAAKEYSVEWAIKGEGVLLHPEGTVRWTNDVVHPLFPGIAQMAMKASELTDRPVFVVPIVWKYRYVIDVSRRMHREMRILEDGLGLARLEQHDVSRRFHTLQLNILDRQMRHFDYAETDSSRDFFDRQRDFQEHLIATLERRYSIEQSSHADKRITRLVRAIRTKLADATGDERTSTKHDLAMAEEAKRLGEFTRDVYGTPVLTQEQLYESLKRTRDRMLRRGWKNVIANMLPRPFGPRVVHIGVPEPIRVERVPDSEKPTYEAALLETARARMQAKLHEINNRTADLRRYNHANLFSGTWERIPPNR
jgi:1-acyl-sn-glycerol-3-phosphate acyltransferase